MYFLLGAEPSYSNPGIQQLDTATNLQTKIFCDLSPFCNSVTRVSKNWAKKLDANRIMAIG